MTMEQPTSLRAEGDHPLIGIVLDEDGREVTRYVVDEAAAAAAIPDLAIQAAVQTIGARSDLDWEEIETELRRIREESRPTPPFTDL
jgi:hypothetical protein